MSAIWWKETRELQVVAASAAVAAWMLGVEVARDRFESDHLLVLGAIGGGVGLFQGLLDRLRRSDGFLLHRPISAGRIQGVRSVAGLALLGLAALAACAGAAWWTWRERLSAARAGDVPRGFFFEQPRFPYPEWNALPLDGAGVALAFGFLVGGWAILRYASARPRPTIALFAAGALGIGFWSFVARHESLGAMAAVAVAAAVGLSLLHWADLVGDRR